LQKLINESNEGEQNEEKQMKLLRDILRLAVVGADEITDEEFSNFPLGELTDFRNKL
jgi:hypothetical protein